MEDPHQDRLQLVAEKRKWQTEVENKRRQLEDDKRALQQMKTKALRERWLLEGPDGPEQEDETRTRTLEETICRLEQELSSLETGPVYQTLTTVISGCDAAVEVKGHREPKLCESNPSGQVIQEVKIHKVPQISKSRQGVGEMKKAMYSVEIKVERDRVTGETRVLSTNTTLPVDLSDLGVKVYEDEQKVVHEMNGEDGIHLLSSSEVDELLHKADETSMMLESVSTVTALPKSKVQDGPEPSLGPMMSTTLDPMQSPSGDPSGKLALGPSPGPSPGPFPSPRVAAEISGLEAKSRGEFCKEEPGVAGLGVVGLGMAGLDVAGPDVVEASAENPVTMVFMGYQNVEDEDETKKVFGLQGTVKAELVLIENVDRQVDPPAPSSTRPTSTKPPQEKVVRDEETAGEAERGVVEVKKGKQPCKCCSIM